MKTIEEIENYIKEQEQNGALLVTGKWGSGKTYEDPSFSCLTSPIFSVLVWDDLLLIIRYPINL